MTQSAESSGSPSGERESIYDFPEYYELAFGPDSQQEFEFLVAAAKQLAKRPVRTVFEPACGTGRLIYRLAAAGFNMLGIDLNPRAVEYCRQRLARRRLAGWVEVADMTDFQLPRPVDLAYNMINSFRHLTREEAAESHLRAVARAVEPGGLYVLALHLTPGEGPGTDEETWTSRRGTLQVTTRLWTLSKDPVRREERLALAFDVVTPRRSFQLRDELTFRTYTRHQLMELLLRVPEWEIAGTFDFHYDLDEPIQLNDQTEDVIFVLRREPTNLSR